jgi:hypothetical protein
MDIEEGMINLFSLVKSKQIKVLYKIMHSGNETWSALGKYWLKKFDKDTGEDFFLCKCSNIKGLKLNRIPKFYLNALQSFSKFRTKFTPNSLQDILDTPLFCNENIKFCAKSLFFKSFLLSGLRTIRDIWDEEILNFKDSIQIYNSLFDKRNCISEYSKIKAAIPNTYVSILKKVENLSRNKNGKIKRVDISMLSNYNIFIKPKDLKLKCIQKILNPQVLPKAKIKWENEYDNDINWGQILGNLKKTYLKNKISEFQWKSIHNILYTECKLNRMDYLRLTFL